MTQTEVIQEKKRLLSLDFFRGLTVAAMILVNNPGDWEHIYAPLEHSKWNGCTPTDLIFPFFLFMVGVSIVYAIGARKNDKTLHRQIILKALRRSITIYIIYVAIHFLFVFNFKNFRILGVLPRIAIVFFICVVIYTKTNFRQWLWIFSIILILYCFLMTVIPVPGYAYAILEPGKNLAAWVDNIILTPKHMWSGTKTWDPEGLLSTLPAIATCLSGMMVGSTLKRNDKTEADKVAWLLTFTSFSIIAALIWNNWFSINKALWTSSFVLLAGGLSLLFLSLFYYIIDVLGHKKWAFFFTVIGMNSILIYMSSRFINWKYATDGFFLWFNQLVGEPWNAFTWVFCFLAVKWALLYFLYKKKVFLRV